MVSGRLRLRMRSRNFASPPSLRAVVVAACCHSTPVRSVRDVAAAGGMSQRSLQRRCQAMGVSAKAILDLVWCLRAVTFVGSSALSPSQLFPELDPRTALRLRKNAGLGTEPVSLNVLLRQQRFITSPDVLVGLDAELAAALASRNWKDRSIP